MLIQKLNCSLSFVSVGMLVFSYRSRFQFPTVYVVSLHECLSFPESTLLTQKPRRFCSSCV